MEYDHCVVYHRVFPLAACGECVLCAEGDLRPWELGVARKCNVYYLLLLFLEVFVIYFT